MAGLVFVVVHFKDLFTKPTKFCHWYKNLKVYSDLLVLPLSFDYHSFLSVLKTLTHANYFLNTPIITRKASLFISI